MIDIHSHILPAVDDGARNLAMAMDMLRMAIDSGVKTQVLTPHIQPGTFNNTRTTLTPLFRQFVDQVNDAGLKIELKLASEVRIGPELIPLFTQNEIPVLGELEGRQAFLLEFPPYEVPFGSTNLVSWLLQRNYLPIIVHPERNKTFTRHPEKLEPFLQLGCPVQLTASSLRGKFGADAKTFAFDLIKRAARCFVATDCHNVTTRYPDLDEAVQVLSEGLYREQLMSLVQGIPATAAA